MRHGGQILVDQLKRLGVRRVFSVPGESFLAALDGLYESGIANIVCRQEGGAAMMAEAHGKLTGEVGVAFVTRGPGATNASAGLHVARQDSTAMVLFVGQIERAHRDREAFQELDYRGVFGPMVKWAAEVDQTERLPEYISRAFRIATSGRPGPVVLALPEDMLSAMADVPDLAAPIEEAAPDLAATAGRICAALAGAERPMLVLGGPHWSEAARADLEAFAADAQIPVAVSFRRQDRIDNRHPCYVGDLNVGPNPALSAALGRADLLVVLGARLTDVATKGFTALDPAKPPRLIHIHSDPDELGRVWRPELAVPARADAMAAALRRAGLARPSSAWLSEARAAYEDWRSPPASPGALRLEEVIRQLSETLPADAIITNGAGNYAAWLHRVFQWKQMHSQLAPTSGSMGYGLPAAIAAALEHPERQVICFAGDGCLQMTINEMSTALQHGAKPIVIVVNNGRYGTIRMHQEMHYPGRISGTMLANPDFAALAEAYGGHGEVVTQDAEFAPAFARAQAAGRLAVIELRVDVAALAPGRVLPG